MFRCDLKEYVHVLNCIYNFLYVPLFSSIYFCSYLLGFIVPYQNLNFILDVTKKIIILICDTSVKTF